MIEKNRGEELPQKHEKERGTILDLKDVVSSILDEGKISIEKSDTNRYPSEAREMLETITEEDVKKVILEQADFSEATTWYFNKLDEKGRPNSKSNEKTDLSLGISRDVCLTIRKDESKNIKICANTDLLHIYGQKPEIKVYLYASKITLNFPSYEDGRCEMCEGWGCWECGYGGGY